MTLPRSLSVVSAAALFVILGAAVPACQRAGETATAEAVEPSAGVDLGGPGRSPAAEAPDPEPTGEPAAEPAGEPEPPSAPGPAGDPEPGAGPMPPLGPKPMEPDPSDALFDPEQVLQVSLTMAPDAWDELRLQTRDFLDVLGPGCLDGPAPDAFTWFEADVEIDGQLFGQVGVRKKGFLGSLSEDRPSLKVRLDKFVDGQELHTVTRMTFNNGKQDPAIMQACLAYSVFTAAGLPAPRCTFARVHVNGQDLGVYSHVEEVRRPFLQRHFGDKSGDLYEGTLSDFRPAWVNTFEAKTGDTDDDGAVLHALIDALDVSNGKLESALEELVDLDAFFLFWATEVLVSHWDGYTGNTNNFFVYADPTDGDRLRFIPWGADATFGEEEDEDEDEDEDEEEDEDEDEDEQGGGGERERSPGAGPAVLAVSALPHRLYDLPPMRERYAATLTQLLDEVWDEQALLDEVDRIVALLTPELSGPPLAIFKDRAADLAKRISGRRGALLAALAQGPPPWDAPLRDSICLAPVGTIHSVIATTWGTNAGADPFSAGTGTVTLDLIDPKPISILSVGAMAGADLGKDPSGQTAIMASLAAISPTQILVHAVWLPTPLVEADVTYPLGLQGFESALFVFIHEGNKESFELVGWVAEGTLSLQAAGHTWGAPIEADFDAVLLGGF